MGRESGRVLDLCPEARSYAENGRRAHRFRPQPVRSLPGPPPPGPGIAASCPSAGADNGDDSPGEVSFPPGSSNPALRSLQRRFKNRTPAGNCPETAGLVVGTDVGKDIAPG